MGMGDDMMWLGEAYKVHQETGKKIAPQKDGRIRSINFSKQPAFQNIDWLSIDGYPVEQRPNNGKRWYHDVENYKPIPARLQLTSHEESYGKSIKAQHGDYIVINPDAKTNAHHASNKHWPKNYWYELTELLKQKGKTVIRCRPSGNFEFAGAIDITTNVRDFFAIIKYASYVITTDGLAHHTAAAFNIPCTVIWGHCTSPKHLGYEYQKDLVTDLAGAPCYTIHKDCDVCKKAMQKITPKQVLETVFA